MRRPLLFCAALALLASGCATVPKDPAARAAYRANRDPLEPMNRTIFSFNQKVDRRLIRPVAQACEAFPSAVRDALRNFAKNLEEPVVFANNVLQGEFGRASITVARLVVNPTAGVAGFRDPASHNRLPRQIGDFGQTLHVWGVPEGPYLVIPIVGPSNPRDGVGMGVDVLLNPLYYVRRDWATGLSIGTMVTGGIDERARATDALDELQRESIDFYAALRSLFRQNREAELRNGAAPPQSAGQDLYSDPDAAPPAPPR